MSDAEYNVVGHPTDWELEQIENEVPWQPDDSGLDVLVHRIVRKVTHKQYADQIVLVRVDVIGIAGNVPIRSFQGRGDDVRKRIMQWLADEYRFNGGTISREHAAYIGAEIHKAETYANYMQS